MFAKGYKTNWSDKFYTITEVINDTIPSYPTDSSPARYNEALLKKAEVTVQKEEQVLKNLTIYETTFPEFMSKI